MAYTRRNYRRRGNFKRRRVGMSTPWYSKKYSVTDIASSAWKGVKYLKTLVNSEKHKIDSGPASINVDSTGTVVHLTNIAQGDGTNQRTGNSILLSGCSVKLQIALNSAATVSALRILLFHDKQQVADGTPTIGEVLNSVSTMAHLNATNIGRFSILMDKMLMLGTGSNTTKVIQEYFKIQKHVRYNGTAGTDIQKNGLYIMFLSTEPTNVVLVSYGIRVSFHDN